MTATAAQILQVRRMTNERSESDYSDADIQAFIEAYPCLDARGEEPGSYDTSTSPPTWDENEDWIPTYDLSAAAAAIWEEKAAILAQDFDFNADGGDYTRSQAYEQAMKQARYYRSRRKPGTITLMMHPKPDAADDPGWVLNMPESA